MIEEEIEILRVVEEKKEEIEEEVNETENKKGLKLHYQTIKVNLYSLVFLYQRKIKKDITK